MTQLPQTPMYETEHNYGMALSGLVLGILSLAIFWFLGVGLVLGLIGIIVSAAALKRERAAIGVYHSSAKAGLTTSIIGAVLGLLLLVMAIAGYQYAEWAGWMQR